MENLHAILNTSLNTSRDFSKKPPRRFLSHKQGNVVIFFALGLLPLLAAVGAAIDISRAIHVKSQLNSALDAAGLAAGKKIDSDTATIVATAQAYFTANYPANAIAAPGPLSVVVTPSKITLSVSANVENTIMKALGFNDINVATSNEISRAITGLEVALALDNTGSMSGTKLANLKTASHQLIDILFGTETMPTFLKMSIVPFAAGVNVGTSFPTSMLDMAGASSIHSENFTTGTNLWTLYDNITNRNWGGCVMERPVRASGEHLDEVDTPPTAGDPDTMFVPWFAPDEPNGSSPTYPNSYLPDVVTGTAATRQRSTVKYPATGVASSSSTSIGPDYNCRNTQAITALTNDRRLLESRIDAMTAAYLTHIPIGLAWGWRTLSPDAPYTEGKPYGAANNIKALILMTDGENTISYNSSLHNLSTFTGYGFLSQAATHYGSASINTGTEAEDELDAKTARMCASVKAAGIRVYTIAFQVTATATLNLLRNCASTPDKFFASSSASALTAAFGAIAGELAELRLSK